MSSDDPTRRPPATEPAVVTQADELLFRDEVRDRLRSLTTAVALLAVLAVAALGVAIWAVLSSQDDDGTSGASVSRVRALEDQVDQLAAGVDSAAQRDDLQRLNRRQQELAGKVNALDEQVARATTRLEPLPQDVERLQQDVEALERRIDALEQDAAPSP